MRWYRHSVADTSEERIAWTDTPAHAPVIAGDGVEVGHVVEVAALREEDIFHGIVFSHGTLKKHLLAPAADVAFITQKAVHLSVDSAATQNYEEFHQMHIEHLGLSGLFRWKHFSWKDADE